jgi:hypothetical protein
MAGIDLERLVHEVAKRLNLVEELGAMDILPAVLAGGHDLGGDGFVSDVPLHEGRRDGILRSGREQALAGAERPLLVVGPAAGAPAVVPHHGDATEVEPQAIVTGTVCTSRADRLDSPGVMSGKVFRAALERKQRLIDACYNQALPRDPTIAGSVRLVVTVNPQGGVRVEVLSADASLEASGVTQCIQRRLETLNFASPPPRGGVLRVRGGERVIAP